MKKLLTLFLFICLSILRGSAQEEPKAETAEQADEIPSKGLDNIWRSSDLPNETPTSQRQRTQKRIDGSALLPKGSERVGCVCMDYFVQKHLGRGACSGHNGVRFWLYELPSGDTVQIPTLRHEAHPDTLTDAQMLQLAAYKRYERLMTEKQLAFFNTLEEHPNWLLDYLGSTPTLSSQQDTLFVPLPVSGGDNAAKNTLLYSISVLLGSGALYLINKLRGEKDDTKQDNDTLI